MLLLAMAGVLFAQVRPTNFRGFDEWLILSLLADGALDFPYANRPLNLLWWLPAQILFPGSLRGHLIVHAAWIGLTGVLTFLLARRLFRRASGLAFLAGALTIVWAPGDRARLAATQMLLYSGCTFALVLAAWLACEAFVRRRAVLLALAAVAAALGILSFEAILAPLALVPLLFARLDGVRGKRLLVSTALWAALLAAFAARAVWPLWTAPERVHYQAQVEPDTRPGPLAVRMLKQLRRHVRPVVQVPPGGVSWPAVAGVGLLAAGLVAATRRDRRRALPPPTRASLAATGGIGLLWACASYLPFVLSPLTHGAERQQFLSGAGVALLLAASVGWLASWLPERLRPALVFALGAWIVAGGLQRTADMQRLWDRDTSFAHQYRVLQATAAIAPDVEPGTLVVLLDSGAWPFDLTFRHAIRYLYEERGLGHAPNAREFLYETRFESAGILSLPDPVIQQPWHEPPRVFPYETLVVLREEPGRGRVRLVETWPTDLPALPPGARYAPRTRLRLGPLPPRLQALLH